MNTLYLILVVVLFALAFSDLIVGVSNDAVNFLNSAIGSKAAPFKVIMAVAAVGILVGATFSSGMMEVARKGIFNPQHFFFSEIMIIFLAVMMTDIILLDVFNTFGLPTSTTVSIVFELLGAAVGISLIKIMNSSDALSLGEYINTAKALGIISGILLSVVVAFTVGAVVQYITRIIFTFNYTRKLRWFGAVWGGLAISAITYFILIKGVKGASFMSDDIKTVIRENTLLLMVASFIVWTVMLQLLMWVARIDILKLVVLVGTFALAMAFAGNDLVNFIGVPLAGFESFKAFIATPGADADSFMMTALTGKVKTDTYMLVIAGLVMVATLWFSRKARSVVKTSLDLSRQTEGDERFGSSLLARSMVRSAIKTGQALGMVIPEHIKRGINNRFVQQRAAVIVDDAPAFDMLRASVNLVVASILIAFATSLKLPLSTTYVTFMVAMGTSLADRAWGRESAVYRITGVVSVIGGWFFTALSAFTVAFVVALLMHWSGIIGIFVLLSIALFIMVRTHRIHKKRELNNLKEVDVSAQNIVEQCTLKVTHVLEKVITLYGKSIDDISKENRKGLKENLQEVKTLNNQTKHMKDNVVKTIKGLGDDFSEQGHFYVQVLDYLRETAHCLTYIADPSFNHVDNQHKGFTADQTGDLYEVKARVEKLYTHILSIINHNDFDQLQEVIAQRDGLMKEIEQYRKRQIKRIKANESGTRSSMLYLGILHETKNLLLHTVNLMKAQRDFIEQTPHE